MADLTDIIAPLEQEGTKSVVRKWLVAVGDTLAVNDPIVELETDKVSVEVAAESPGVLAEILMQPGEEAEPGAILGRLSSGAGNGAGGAGKTASAPNASSSSASADSPPSQPSLPQGGRAFASFDPELRLSPSVRRLLIEADLDPAGLQGTGRGGRITREDVETAAKAGGAMARPAPAPQSAAPRVSGNVTSVAHDTMRLRIAEHMSHSVTVAPHVTAVFEADFSAISAHRKANKAAFAKQGANLTFTAYIVAAAARAMDAAPAVNARWFDDRLELYDDVNIGIGTALGEKGLVVPVIHQSQSLSLLGIAKRIGELTDKARAGKLARTDVQGGTFSISNHGVSGTLIATPIIINQPQSAILGIGKLEKRVVVREVDGADAILIRPMAYVSLTIDHRVLDGHQTNAWLTRFVEVLEGWRD
jgi:2-oxoglutarate dehydrogenase E2 component (dihydrolipoamide succinyltransferase)